MTGIDRFRNRKTSNGTDFASSFDSEKLIDFISRKRGSEELRIIVGQKQQRSYLLIRTVRQEGGNWLPIRSICFMPDQLEGILNGVDQAAIRHGSIANIPEEDLPAMPLLCGGAGEVQVKLDRFNGFFNIKISKVTGNEFVVFGPPDIEPVIKALVAAYDHTQGNAPETGHSQDFDF
jgi:hypothetical protein